MSDRINPAMEAQYALRTRHPERDQEYATMREAGLALRARHAATLDLRYGDSPRSRLDFFPAGEAAPLLVFLHGGYWRALDKETFSFLAAPLLARGIAVALPGYDLAPGVGVPWIVHQVLRALEWLGREGPGFDRGRVVLAGHSAGAQLAAMAMLRGVPGLGLRGLVGVSGVYDLRPLRQTSVGQSIALDAAQAAACSPALLLPARVGWPAQLIVGGAETDGFVDQTTGFAAALRARGAAAETLTVNGRTHFSVLHDLFEGDRADALEGWFGQPPR